MRIFELTDPRFLNTKARLICRRFKEIVDNRKSIFVNQRAETYGKDMPGPPPGISERQYNNLFGGKGCEECSDRTCTAPKWAWFKRWCATCWEKKIIREDRVIKKHQDDFPRGLIQQLLECLPYCIQDSYMKPHNVSEDRENRPPGGPKVYKFFQFEDVISVIAAYNSLTPTLYIEAPENSPGERATAIAKYKDSLSKLDEARQQFFSERKKENDLLMERVCKIENGIRTRRREVALPNRIAREGRRKYHTKMAKLELPYIPIDFIHKGKAYKASCRIYRNAGTERTWKALKPKIVKEWEQELEKRASFITSANAAESTQPQVMTGNSSINLCQKLSLCNPSVPSFCHAPSLGSQSHTSLTPDFPYLGHFVSTALNNPQVLSNFRQFQPCLSFASTNRPFPHRQNNFGKDFESPQFQHNCDLSQLASEFTVNKTIPVLNSTDLHHESDTIYEQPICNINKCNINN